MTKWEYLRTSYRALERLGGEHQHSGDIYVMCGLTRNGQEGWELVAIVDEGDHEGLITISNGH